MKNKFLKEKLNQYVESVKPDKKLISGAFDALKEKPCKAASAVRFSNIKMFSFVSRALAASFLLFVVLASVPFSDGSQVQYKLSELNYQTLSKTDIQNESKILTLKNEETDASFRMYYSEDETDPKVITSFYRVVGMGGLDEILVVTDLQKGLTDFSSFKNYKDHSVIQGVQISKMRTYENGEYYINVYFEYESVYYIKIASSTENSAEIYVRKLLRKG